jgi:hypothetical protein
MGVSLSGFKERVSGRPTLELMLARQASEASIKRLAWHEQFHALGYGHEHQRRDAPFKWRSASYCAQILGESEEAIKTNLTDPEGDSDDECTPGFDPHSISGYWVLPELTRNGNGNPGAPGCSPHVMVANRELSDWDTISLQRYFPTTNHNHRIIGWSRVRSQPARHSLDAYRSRMRCGKKDRSAERTAHTHYRLKYLDEASLWEPEVSSELTFHYEATPWVPERPSGSAYQREATECERTLTRSPKRSRRR